jgi:hypothetical protein
MIAAVDARTSTAESVLRREDQVEPDDGRANRRQVRRPFGILGVFDDRRQDALGLSQVGEHAPQDVVGVGFGN